MIVGEYPYAEPEAIRARKAVGRAQHFGQQAPPGAVGGVFYPDTNISSGGLMETRIGAVGVARNGGPSSVPESAHMY